MRIYRLLPWPLVLAAALMIPTVAQAQLVPGTGKKVENAGDDFEDPNWSYVYNLPKASEEIDEEKRLPGAYSTNRRWAESALRGTPDHVRRVETPVGGLPGSKGSLLIMSRDTGVPGTRSNKLQQDDLLAVIGRPIPVSRMPSFVVRVFVPPFEDFEKRTGITFGVRAGCSGPRTKTETAGGIVGFFGVTKTTTDVEPYWPGFFIHFNSKHDGRHKEDSAYFILRANQRGQDFRGPDIPGSGWWTLGMSFTPDGMVHYYARPGVEDLRPEDHLASMYCYGAKCETFETFFFNVCSPDDGRTWSTPWIIDDPTLYIAR